MPLRYLTPHNNFAASQFRGVTILHRNNFAAQQFCGGDDFWGVGGYNDNVRCRKILRRQFVGWRFTLALCGFLDPLLTSIGELQSLL